MSLYNNNKQAKHSKKKIFIKKVLRSNYFFPTILLLPIIVLTLLGISGSSIGSYYKIFYGENPKDPNIVYGEPRSIRSDEWLVGTQQSIAQKESGFPAINNNIGNGQNMTLTDLPYMEWSILFKPQNWSFFIMPLNNAFAFKWWIMGYLLIVGCYFFSLKLMPQKRLLSAIISLCIFFGAFVQWWYSYGTLGSLYYSFFIALTTIALFEQKTTRSKVILGILLSYLTICFILILYPPFQIACGIVLAVFLAGYLFNKYINHIKDKEILKSILIIAVALLISAGITGLFVFTRSDVIKTINNTTYPGKRIAQSGEFYKKHFFASHLGSQFLSDDKSKTYLINGVNHTNQSEASNFLLLIPFLLIPSTVLLLVNYKKSKEVDWPLLIMNALFVVFLLHLFVPQFSIFSKYLLLDKVPSSRLLIGIGLLNTITIVLLIRNLERSKYRFNTWFISGYCLLIFLFQLYISYYFYSTSIGFIGLYKSVLLSVPVSVIIFLLLKKQYLLSMLLYLVFGIYISAQVNPLYKGLGVLTNSELSQAIKSIGLKSNSSWISDERLLQGIATTNGERSISGVYFYPQKDLWISASFNNDTVYNRYANVVYQDNEEKIQKTELKLIADDAFTVLSDPCNKFFKDNNIEYIVSINKVTSNCATIEKFIDNPATDIYIYKVDQ